MEAGGALEHAWDDDAAVVVLQFADVLKLNQEAVGGQVLKLSVSWIGLEPCELVGGEACLMDM